MKKACLKIKVFFLKNLGEFTMIGFLGGLLMIINDRWDLVVLLMTPWLLIAWFILFRIFLLREFIVINKAELLAKRRLEIFTAIPFFYFLFLFLLSGILAIRRFMHLFNDFSWANLALGLVLVFATFFFWGAISGFFRLLRAVSTYIARFKRF